MSMIAVVDILLVAIIIYELLALIKGTRAAYMLVGVAVLGLALYFSSVGELTTLNWLLERAIAVHGVRLDRYFLGGDPPRAGAPGSPTFAQPWIGRRSRRL